MPDPAEVVDALNLHSRKWILAARGVMDRPPDQLLCFELAEQIDPELFYPPCYQLTRDGREVQKILRVDLALKRG